MFEDISLNNTILLSIALIGFPVLVVLLGEVGNYLRRRGRQYASSVFLIRNVVLPLIALYLIAYYVVDFPADGLINRLFITASVIIGLVAVLGIINGLLFEGAGTRVPKLFLDLGRILVIVLGIAVVLSLVWDYDLNNLIAALGVSSIVIGLALQDTLGNLFNGITLINEQPFVVGDYIEVDGFAGQVVEVNWRAVRLLTRERDLIVLPHIKVAQSAILNHSQPEEHWAQKVMLGFSYGSPPNVVKRVIMDTLLATPGVLPTPEPEVKVDAFDDSSVGYEIEYYIASFGEREEVKDAFMTRVWYAARRADLEIPFPQLNLHREPQMEIRKATAAEAAADIRFALKRLDVLAEEDNLSNSDQVSIIDFGEGEILISPQQRTPGLFFLLSGEVRMSTLEQDEESAEMALLHRGDFFVELILRGRRENCIEVQATTDVKTVHFSDRIIRSLVNRYPVLANRIEDTQQARRKQAGKIKAIDKI